MREILWILLLGSLGNLAGCSEFIASGEKTTTIDVVGDPADPIADSMAQADIVGSALPLPDDLDSISDANAVRGTPKSLPDDPADSTENPEGTVDNSGLKAAKPVSLKTKPADTSDQ